MKLIIIIIIQILDLSISFERKYVTNNFITTNVVTIISCLYDFM